MNEELFPEEAKKLFEALLLTKQEIWNYENEYRSIIPIKILLKTDYSLSRKNASNQLHLAALCRNRIGIKYYV